MREQTSSPDTQSQIILYTAADGKVTADVFFAKETFWLTQRTMAELFGIKAPAISKHLKNIYASGELTEAATISKMETVQMEGERQWELILKRFCYAINDFCDLKFILLYL